MWQEKPTIGGWMLCFLNTDTLRLFQPCWIFSEALIFYSCCLFVYLHHFWIGSQESSPKLIRCFSIAVLRHFRCQKWRPNKRTKTIMSSSSRESSSAVKRQLWPAEKWEEEEEWKEPAQLRTLWNGNLVSVALQGYCVCAFRGITCAPRSGVQQLQTCSGLQRWEQQQCTTQLH